MKHTIALLIAIAGLAATATAFAAGKLDPTFGDGGVRIMRLDAPIADVQDTARDGLVDRKGRYVTVGASMRQEDFLKPYGQVTRHFPDGQLDLSFAGKGYLRFRPPPLQEGQSLPTIFRSVDEQIHASNAGKLVVGGTSDDGRKPIICRFSEAGVVDMSFGVGGCITLDYPVFATANLTDLAVLADDRILALVDVAYIPQRSYELFRFTADGNVDLTFGAGCDCGRAPSPAYVYDAMVPAALAVDEASGNIAVVGDAVVGDNDNYGFMLLTRHLENGAIDTAYSQSGIKYIDFDAAHQSQIASSEGTIDIAVGLAFVENGAVVIAGQAVARKKEMTSQDRIALAKVEADGSLAAGFGTTGPGLMLSRFGEASEIRVSAFSVLSDGSLVVGGRTHTDGPQSAAMKRFTSNGYEEPNILPITIDVVPGYNEIPAYEGSDASNRCETILSDKNSAILVGNYYNPNINAAEAGYVGTVANPYFVKVDYLSVFKDGFE